MVRHTLKILHQMLQDFKSVSDQFETLCIKGLRNRKSDFSSNRRFLIDQSENNGRK